MESVAGEGLPRVGVRLPQYGGDWRHVLAFARRADRLGFASLWANDHLMSPGRRRSEPAFDACTTLAALAPLVSGPRLGVAVLSASYRPPAVAAKFATLLDVISGGRVVVGLGTGSHRGEHAAYGIPFASAAQRTARCLEALAVMREMFRSPHGADLPGLLSEAPNLPAPAQAGGPPVWLAAHGPVLLRAAGVDADGVVAAFAEPEEVSRRLAIARAARPEDRPPLECALYTYVVPSGSEAEMRGWLAPEADALGTTPGALLRWLRTTGIVGRHDEVRERLAEHRAAGVTEAILVLPSRVPLEALEALAEATATSTGPVGPRSASVNSAVRATAPGVEPGENLVDLLVERHLRTGGAERTAVIDDDGRWTYRELSSAAARAGGALSGAGVRAGDRVALALPDGRSWCAAFLGAARLGAVPVPLDPAGDAATIGAVLADCEPALVVQSGEEAIRHGFPLITPIELDAGPEAPVRAVHRSDLAYLIYSSGSTGRPKGAMHAHGDMRVGIETYASEVLRLTPGERCHSAARLFTSLGFGNGFFRVLGPGATAVMSARQPSVRSVLATVRRHGVSVLSAVPTLWSQIERFVARHGGADELSGLRLAISSGDALPQAVARRLQDELGLDLIEGFGCSECSNIVISTRPGERWTGDLGRPVAGVEVRLADDDGRPVAPGEPGRLWIASDSNTSGYWRRPEMTRELVHGRWLRMGDLLVEHEGSYRHVGRADDLFKVDGRWVSPTAIESVLVEHEAVSEARVVGLPDDRGLLRAAAFVVTANGPVDRDTAGALRRSVSRSLGTHAAPSSITALEGLPRLPSGKLDRRSLRALGEGAET